MLTAGLTELNDTGKIYLGFLNEVLLSIQDKYPRIEQLLPIHGIYRDRERLKFGKIL